MPDTRHEIAFCILPLQTRGIRCGHRRTANTSELSTHASIVKEVRDERDE